MNADKPRKWKWTKTATVVMAMAMAMTVIAGCGGGNSGSDGGTKPNPVPSTPPPVVIDPISRIDAIRFLSQAAFGAKESDIARVQAVGYAAWIEEQFNLPATAHRSFWESANAKIVAADPKTKANQNELLNSFWKSVATSDDQLRQRVTFALSQIFVISMLDNGVGGNPQGAAGYVDMLGEKGFGKYVDLLEGVSRHPMMGYYLSHWRNQKEDPITGRVPDQNFAREVMQLFSIGLHELNADGTQKRGPNGPIETYTSDDIVGMSRVFTGFSYYGPDASNNRFFHGSLGFTDQLWRPMQGYSQYHSILEKKFLGTVIPAQTTAAPETSLKTAVSTLAKHQNAGPFIGKQLIQRLVTSNPSPGYVERVTASFNGSDGDLKAVIRAIFLDKEARDSSFAASTNFGRIREPVLRLAYVMRTFDAKSFSNSFLLGTTDDPGFGLGQTFLRANSVFNFYRPGYVAPNSLTAAAGLVAPELQITNETSTAGYVNFMRNSIENGFGAYDGTNKRNDIQLDISGLLTVASDEVKLVSKINELMLYGQMPKELSIIIEQGVKSIVVPAALADGSNKIQIDAALRNRVNSAIFLTSIAPEYIVLK